MSFSAPVHSLLRPGGDLSSSIKTMIQRHRLLALLGAVLVLALGSLYDATSPEAVTSVGARLGIAGLLLALFGLSYISEHVRRHFPLWMRGVLYLLVAWYTLLASANGFAGDYDMGMLLVYAILPGVVAMGTERMRPVLWFMGVSFLMGTGGVVLGPTSLPKGIAVLSSLASVALVEGIALQAHLSTEEELREREERLEGLTHSLPGVVFQGHIDPGETHEFHFLSEHAESLLGIPSDPEGFYERFVARIPDDHRDAFLDSIDTAAETRATWRQEVPYEMPSGERRWLLWASTPRQRDEGVVFNGVILDITERKKAERALREERDRFETLFESLPTPVVRCTVEDEGTLIADANGAFEEVFGVDVDSVEGQDANQLLLSSEELPDEEREMATAIDQRVLQKESMRAEVRRAAAGGTRDFQLQAAGRTPPDGPPELYAIYTDITEKKRYERELEKLTTRIQLALEATDTGFWEWDIASDTLFLDEACEQLIGYEPGTFPGTPEAFADRVHAEDLDHMKRQRQCALDTGERYEADFRVELPGGEVRWIQSRGVVEYDETGDPQRMLGIQTDITSRKEREQELRRKERRYQAIFEDPNILAGLLDPDGTLLEVNQTALEYVDAARTEVTDRPFWKTPWWERSMQTAVRKKLERAANGEYVNLEADLTTPEGKPYSVAGIIRPVTDQSGEVVSLVVSARDITERKRRARKLLEAKEEAEDANQMKSAFLANMSHEIRTPLTSIIGFAEAIGDEVDADAEGTVPRFADLIEQSGRQLLNTLNAVLNLSKLEAGEMQLTPEPVALGEQAKEVAEQPRPRAEEADIDLHVQTSEVSARADTGGLQVVLRNLLSNAIKYTKAGGQVHVRTYREDETPVLEVEDTGIGMDPEQVPILFEPFRQASEGTSREYEGTGLGLAVTKRMINQMGGEISADTEKEVGTCFVVRLPRCAASVEQA